MSDVKRRIDSEAANAAPASSEKKSIEYDGANAPVLIRLPELASGPVAAAPAERTQAASPPPESTPKPPSEEKAPNRRQSRRRIDRGHLPQRPRVPLPETTPFDVRSKSFVAMLLIAVIGLSYVFLRSGADPAEEPKNNDWAQTPATPDAERHSAEKLGAGGQTLPEAGAYPDLWPSQNDPLADSRPTTTRPQTQRPQDQYQPQNGTAATLPSAPSQALNEARQPWRNEPPPMTWPVGATEQQQQPLDTTTPSSIQPSRPMKQVSWPPDENDGAAVARPGADDLAGLVGLQRQSYRDPQLALQATPPTPPRRRNHERLRTSIGID